MKNYKPDNKTIIFLDIDGVCNRNTSINIIDIQNMIWLNLLLGRTNASVVIISSYRVTQSIKNLQDLMGKYGFKGKIIDFTPELDGCRGDEIQQWLDNNPVDRYVILDDRNTMPNHQDDLVLVNRNYGLSKSDVDKAIKILTRND
jgi:hypothetical protein